MGGGVEELNQWPRQRADHGEQQGHTDLKKEIKTGIKTELFRSQEEERG